MQIRVRTTGAVMYEAEFRAYQQANGGPTWGATTEEILDSLGADVVFEGPQAQPTRYQVSFADGVEQIEDAQGAGKWYTKYSVADMDTDAIAAKDTEQAKSVRTSRGEKLKDSDWTQVADAPVDQAAWATYRQALRDITSQEGFPWAITWPTEPQQ
jgi:hypothetical protein